MSVWIENFKNSMKNHPVVILHGNVRDKYIDQSGQIFSNLTGLLKAVSNDPVNPFSEIIFYDPVGQERTSKDTGKPPTDQPQKQDKELKKQKPPEQILARWERLLSARDNNTFATLYYLDKLVSYKASYQGDEAEYLLRLEKIIENITSNNRLILVALQDTLIPIEIYTNSPNTSVVMIPTPSKIDRESYLKYSLGEGYEYLELIANLTDGLYLKDLDSISDSLKHDERLSSFEVRRRVNEYRIGQQEDKWETVTLDKIKETQRWFVEVEIKRPDGKVERGGGIKGQTEAIQKVTDMLCLAKAGLTGLASGTAAKPKGVLFFSGPTGVGKSYLAKKLSLFLFSDEDSYLRFDMSEYKEEHTVAKLIGSPPGYVGYEEGGLLTNAVREKPFSVILFDEIEKAHPKIMDIFLQILDEGRLTDSRGQTVFFTEAVIIFTSNIGTRTLDSSQPPRDISEEERGALDDILINKEGEERKKAVQEHFVQAVERFFSSEISRPELLNRFGNNIVPFNYIDDSQIQKDIVNSHLKRITKEFEDQFRSRSYRLVFDENISDWLVSEFGENIKKMGGRGITNALNDVAMLPLARAILDTEDRNQTGVTFRLGNPVEENGKFLLSVDY